MFFGLQLLNKMNISHNTTAFWHNKRNNPIILQNHMNRDRRIFRFLKTNLQSVKLKKSASIVVGFFHSSIWQICSRILALSVGYILYENSLNVWSCSFKLLKWSKSFQISLHGIKSCTKLQRSCICNFLPLPLSAIFISYL